MRCKNDPKKRYTGKENTPLGKGYSSHGEKIGTKKKGLDGNMYVVKSDKNGRKRWTRVVSTKNQRNASPRMGIPSRETMDEVRQLIENAGLKSKYDLKKIRFLQELVTIYKESPIPDEVEMPIILRFIPNVEDIANLDTPLERENYKYLIEGILPSISTASGIYRNLPTNIGNMTKEQLDDKVYPDIFLSEDI